MAHLERLLSHSQKPLVMHDLARIARSARNTFVREQCVRFEWLGMNSLRSRKHSFATTNTVQRRKRPTK